jgi:anthranilate/para-aminobenzoate synthase component I
MMLSPHEPTSYGGVVAMVDRRMRCKSNGGVRSVFDEKRSARYESGGGDH